MLDDFVNYEETTGPGATSACSLVCENMQYSSHGEGMRASVFELVLHRLNTMITNCVGGLSRRKRLLTSFLRLNLVPNGCVGVAVQQQFVPVQLSIPTAT
jgi:hypothetical protein